MQLLYFITISTFHAAGIVNSNGNSAPRASSYPPLERKRISSRPPRLRRLFLCRERETDPSGLLLGWGDGMGDPLELTQGEDV